jgi:hypothetical protein
MKTKNILWKRKKINPYDIIEKSFSTLVAGDYPSAIQHLENATAYIGRFFSSGSFEDNELQQTIELLRYILHNHPEEFRELIANDKAVELNLDYKHRYF